MQVLSILLGSMLLLTNLQASQERTSNLKQDYKSQNIDHRGPIGHRGHRGKPGKKGNTGHSGNISNASASAFSDPLKSQGVLVTGGSGHAPVQFLFNVVPPHKIVHPVLANVSQFQVEENGVYLIEWSMNVSAPSAPTDVTITLRNVTTSTQIDPIPNAIQTIAIAGDLNSISGENGLFLPAGTVIQLEIATSTEEITISNPFMQITKISS